LQGQTRRLQAAQADTLYKSRRNAANANGENITSRIEG